MSRAMVEIQRLRAALAAAEKRAEEAERTLREARAVALEGNGLTHEQALAAVVGLVADLKRDRASLAEAREVLREVEWSGNAYDDRCPCCGIYATDPVAAHVHHADCRLARALSADPGRGRG